MIRRLYLGRFRYVFEGIRLLGLWLLGLLRLLGRRGRWIGRRLRLLLIGIGLLGLGLDVRLEPSTKGGDAASGNSPFISRRRGKT